MKPIVLLTGITGKLGRRLLSYLVDREYMVYGVYRENIETLEKKFHEKRGDNFRLFPWDLSVEQQTADFEQADILVHTAAKILTPGVTTEEYVRSNVLSIRNLIKLISHSNIKKIINFSSVCVHGTPLGDSVSEDSPVMSPTTYGITKYLAEMYLQDLQDKIGVLSLRLPGIAAKGNPSWLPTITKKAFGGEPIEIFNSGSLFNNAVIIKDLCRFVESVCQQDLVGHDAITLAAGMPLKIGKVVNKVIEATNSTSEVREIPSEKKAFTVSIDKACREYGYEPSTVEEMVIEVAREMSSEGRCRE